jgi:multicomponent Na+:H+ antiporter subunit G
MLEIALSLIGGAVMVAGLTLMAGGTLGLLRFPDFYTRLHAVRVADGPGAVIFILGLAIVSGDPIMALRLVLLAALVAAIGPTSAGLLANAAHGAGLAPLAGAYAAPRPDARGGRGR